VQFRTAGVHSPRSLAGFAVDPRMGREEGEEREGRAGG